MATLPVPVAAPDRTPATSGQARIQVAMRTLLIAALILLGLWIIKSFIIAIVWAVVLAIAVWPLYTRALRRFPPGRHNILMPSLFTFGVGLLFIVPLIAVGIEIAREGRDLLNWYRHVQASGWQPPEFLSRVSFGNWNATDWWRQNLTNPPELGELAHSLNRASLLGLTQNIVHRVVLFFFTLLTLFFLFRNGDAVGREMVRASERAFGPRGERVGRQMILSVHGTVDGLVLVGLGEGVLIGISYWIAGVPHPTVLGAITAVAAMIPFGAPIVFILAALLAAGQGSIVGAVAVVVFGFIVTGVADHAVRPVLIGGATKLPFIWVLFGILGGVESFSLLGLFIGPAVMAALILLWRELIDQEHSGQQYSGQEDSMAEAGEPAAALPTRQPMPRRELAEESPAPL